MLKKSYINVLKASVRLQERRCYSSTYRYCYSTYSGCCCEPTKYRKLPSGFKRLQLYSTETGTGGLTPPVDTAGKLSSGPSVTHPELHLACHSQKNSSEDNLCSYAQTATVEELQSVQDSPSYLLNSSSNFVHDKEDFLSRQNVSNGSIRNEVEHINSNFEPCSELLESVISIEQERTFNKNDESLFYSQKCIPNTVFNDNAKIDISGENEGTHVLSKSSDFINTSQNTYFLDLTSVFALPYKESNVSTTKRIDNDVMSGSVNVVADTQSQSEENSEHMTLRNKLWQVQSYQQLMKLFQDHHENFSLTCYDDIVQEILQFIKTRKCRSSEVLVDPVFVQLCDRLATVMPNMVTSQQITVFKMLGTVRLPTSHPLIQATMQGIEEGLKSISFEKLIFILFLLMMSPQTSSRQWQRLVEATVQVLGQHEGATETGDLSLPVLIGLLRMCVNRGCRGGAELSLQLLYDNNTWLQEASASQVTSLIKSLCSLHTFWQREAQTAARMGENATTTGKESVVVPPSEQLKVAREALLKMSLQCVTERHLSEMTRHELELLVKCLAWSYSSGHDVAAYSAPLLRRYAARATAEKWPLRSLAGVLFWMLKMRQVDEGVLELFLHNFRSHADATDAARRRRGSGEAGAGEVKIEAQLVEAAVAVTGEAGGAREETHFGELVEASEASIGLKEASGGDEEVVRSCIKEPDAQNTGETGTKMDNYLEEISTLGDSDLGICIREAKAGIDPSLREARSPKKQGVDNVMYVAPVIHALACSRKAYTWDKQELHDTLDRLLQHDSAIQMQDEQSPISRLATDLISLGHYRSPVLQAILTHCTQHYRNGRRISAKKELQLLRIYQASVLLSDEPLQVPNETLQCWHGLIEKRAARAVDAAPASVTRQLLLQALPASNANKPCLVSGIYTNHRVYVDHVVVVGGDGWMVPQRSGGGCCISSLDTPRHSTVLGLLEVSPTWLINDGAMARSNFRVELRLLAAEGVTPVPILISELMHKRLDTQHRVAYITDLLRQQGFFL